MDDSRYTPGDDGGMDLASFVRFIPRRTPLLWAALVKWWLRRFVRLGLPRASGIDALRARVQHVDRARFRVPADVTRRRVDCNGVPADWLEVPESVPHRAVLFLHGGAFSLRMPNAHACLVARWCRLLGARALMPFYRLAPEHPFPAAPDDCLAAYRWLLAQGIASRDVVIAGDSAGASLALSTLYRIKSSRLPMPACAIALSPVTDARLVNGTLRSRAAHDPILCASSLSIFRDMYARPEHYRDPACSPLLADYGGVAPIMIQVGTSEVLLDDARLLAQRVHESGVPVALEVWEDMPHVFQALPMLTESALALSNMTRFARAHARWAPVAGAYN